MNIRRMLFALAVVLIVLAIIVGGWTFYDAWQLGVLPWQPEPTRTVVTPFADLPTPTVTPGS